MPELMNIKIESLLGYELTHAHYCYFWHSYDLQINTIYKLET